MQLQTDLKAGGDRLQCFSRLLTVAAHAFSFLTVVINVADVATDIVVCIAFWQEGETLWFGLVLASLLLSHLVYTVTATFLLPSQSHMWRPYGFLPLPLRLLVSLLIAQFVPFINFVLESCHDVASPPAPQLDFGRVVGATAAGDESAVSATLGQAADEEFAGVARSQMLNERLRLGIQSHFRKFGLFYVETVVEAAPQAVIQLLAISFLGRATEAQLLSLCFSLFSITSKMVVLSRSYDARVMMFNFLLFAHDVFSTYYLFTTVIAVETARDVSLGSLHLSWLGYVWLLKVVITMAFAVVSGIAGLIIIVVVQVQDGKFSQNKYPLLAGVLASVVLFAPAALVFEACKLSWWPLSRRIDSNAKVSCDPRVGLLVSFLSRDDRHSSRLRFILNYIAAAHCVVAYNPAVTATMTILWHGAIRTEAARRTPFASEAERAGAANLSLQQCIHGQPRVFFTPMWRYFRRQRSSTIPLSVAKNLVGTSFTLRVSEWNHAGWLLWKESRRAWNTTAFTWRTVLLSLWGGTACAMVLLGQAVSFAYPFVNAGFQFHTHNTLQATCFYAACAALLGAICLAPTAFYCNAVESVFGPLLSPFLSQEALLLAVADYHQPAHVGVLQSMVSPRVLPADVTDLVARFITPRDVGIHHLTIAECDELKRDLAARDAPTMEEHEAADETSTPSDGVGEGAASTNPFGEDQDHAMMTTTV
jgi:hypothetical protein